jgi:hypothetical protein
MIGTILEVADAHFRDPSPRMAEVAEIVDLARHSSVHTFDYDPEADDQLVRQDFCLTDVPENWDGTPQSGRVTLIPYLDTLADEVYSNHSVEPAQIGAYVPGSNTIMMRRLEDPIGQGLLGLFEYAMASSDKRGLLPAVTASGWDEAELLACGYARLNATSLVVQTMEVIDDSGAIKEWVDEQASRRVLGVEHLEQEDGGLHIRAKISYDPVTMPPSVCPISELWSDQWSQAFVADSITVVGALRKAYELDPPDVPGSITSQLPEQARRQYQSAQMAAIFWQNPVSIHY